MERKILKLNLIAWHSFPQWREAAWSSWVIDLAPDG